MLGVSYLRDHKDEAIERLALKNFTDVGLIENVLQQDEQRKRQRGRDRALRRARQPLVGSQRAATPAA